MSKLSRGGIAGIVVGCVLVLLTILLCFYELRLRKKARLAAPEAGLPVPGASGRPDKGESYELGLGYAIPSRSSYGPPTHELSSYGPPTHELSSYGPPTHGLSSYGPPTHGLSSYGPPTNELSSYGPPTNELSSYGPPTNELSSYVPSRHHYRQYDSTFAQKVREVTPDPVGGEVWMPRLFEKVRVRLKTIQDDLELA
jgi:hypothetical protein